MPVKGFQGYLNRTMKKLIINADDFGISRSANTAILNCFKHGVLDSTTLMVNMPHANEAIKLAHKHKIPVGLHFNLTTGRPVSAQKDVPTLINQEGTFYTRREFIKKYLLKQIKLSDIIVEFKAQILKFRDSSLNLEHIDSHQHIHMLPKIFDVLAEYCQVHVIPLRMVIQAYGVKQSLKKQFKTKILAYYARRNQLKWQNTVCMNPYLMSVFDVISNDANLNVDIYRQLLLNLPDSSTEFMVHPVDSSPSNSENNLTRISHISRQEYDILMSRPFSELLNELKIKRILYSKLSK
jgi:predicted glycoside hydrolase/deacetylase ChbG (UPF0249 family)